MDYPEGNPFRELRTDKGWSQKELVEVFKKNGITLDNRKISRLETGRFTTLDTYTQNAYVKVFHVSNEYLLGQTPKVKTTNKKKRMICNTTGLSENAVTFLEELNNRESRLLKIIDFLLSHFNNIADLEDALCDYFYSHDDTPLLPVINKKKGKRFEYLSSDTTSTIFNKDEKERKPLKDRKYMLTLSDKPNGNPTESFMLSQEKINILRELHLVEKLCELRERFQNEGK
ncbi:MAG: helix-turn-helix domain-containing protein [Lachnospiraceae bacterium]|nr:helix-turn-helix domain-containing protein [Lachnospiraceae bacterium]